MGGSGPQRGPTTRCSSCEHPEVLGKPLFACAKCRRYYHVECARPARSGSSRGQWNCKHCVTLQSERSKDGTSSIDDLADSATRSSPSLPSSRSVSAMSRETSFLLGSISGQNSFLEEEEGTSNAALGMKCCYPDCDQITATEETPLCRVHAHGCVSPKVKIKEPSETRPIGNVFTNTRLVPDSASSPGEAMRKKPPMKRTGSLFTRLLAKQSRLKQISFLLSERRKANGNSVSTQSPSSEKQIANPHPSCPSGSGSPLRKKQRLTTPSDSINGDAVDSYSPRPSRTPRSRNSFVSNRPPNRFLSDEQQPSAAERRRDNSPATSGHRREHRPAGSLSSSFTSSLLTEDGVGSDILSNVNGEGSQRKDPINGHGVLWREQGARRRARSGSENESDNYRPVSKSSRNSVASPRTTANGSARRAKAYARSKVVAKSLYTHLPPITRSPPMEKQRQSLVETLDTSGFDTLVYGQTAPSERPEFLNLPDQQGPPGERGAPFFGHIDPRTHWTRPHSEAWYERKQKEITARGGRKANFGKAAARMREQKARDGPTNLEDSLPDHVLGNANWVSAMHWFEKNRQQLSRRDKEASSKGKARRKRAPAHAVDDIYPEEAI